MLNVQTTEDDPNPSAAGDVGRPSPDWEAVFEDPDSGIISLIMRSRSPDAIRKSIDLIVSTLFSRAGDARRREAFSALLTDIAGTSESDDGSFELVRHRLAMLLRGIKDDRVVRARLTEAESYEAVEPVPCGPDRRREEPDIIADVGEPAGVASQWSLDASREIQAHGETFEVVRYEGHIVRQRLAGMPVPESLEQAFADVFLISLEERFAVLRGKLTADSPVGGRMPFLLSEEFAERYVSIVADDILPVLLPRCRSVFESLSHLKPEQWRIALMEEFTNREQRLRLWEAWQSAWLECTSQTPFPPKPGAGVHRSFHKEVRTGDSLPQQSMEDWRKDVSFIKKQNTAAVVVWSRFTAFAESFHAPLDQDNRLLMELFGRSAGGIVDQIAALLQIAVQRDGTARLFDTYQRGKSVDMALLAACYQYPDVFVTGAKPMLAVLVRSYGRRRRLEALPLTSRYLSDRMS